ncbi:primosomal protein N' [Actinomyces wuliandei]|uniref:primosomal protein N' family DNA-binding protein n=1 Tax=Actinomyces wuliandei TaxID=2057743 RepID=UPI0015D5A038|nr:primosomal protein N' [Actinomyces wuliandei]
MDVVGDVAGSAPSQEVQRTGSQGELLSVPRGRSRPVQVPGTGLPVARVLLDSPVPHLDRTFDYSVPDAMREEAVPGTRVVVRFGGQEMRGWVWERADTTTHLGHLAPLRRVVSDLSVLPAASRRLVEAVAARSAGVRSDVVRLALPPRHAATEHLERTSPAPAGYPTWTAPSSDGTWGVYDGGAQFLADLAAGGFPRAGWCALPRREGVSPAWQHCVTVAAQASLAGGRGVLVVVATKGQAEAVADTLGRELPGEPVAILSAEHGTARRYRAFLQVLLGRARVVVGTRSAAFAPVADLGLAVVWDDGDSRLEERHAPYVQARTVLALRSSLEGSGLLLAGYSRSAETQALVDRGWCTELSVPRAVARRAAPLIEVPGAPELEAEGASGTARVPSLAHRALASALREGPVLVQVPRSGYAPVVACLQCREVARCPHCSGPLAMSRGGRTACRWCARPVGRWRCPQCGGTRLRMVSVGSSRTGEELGRAFPQVPVLVSGTREDHGVVGTVGPRPRIVVATPGAEPAADGGYRAVLILDGAVISSRPDLGAAHEALRLWTGAAVLAAPGARVVLLGRPAPAVAQAFLRWDHVGFARRELREREELHLPPAWRAARLDGHERSVEGFLAQAQAQGFETLGPVLLGPVGESAGDGGAGEARALIRCPASRGSELSAMLRHHLRERSVRRREDPVRVELDPTFLW